MNMNVNRACYVIPTMLKLSTQHEDLIDNTQDSTVITNTANLTHLPLCCSSKYALSYLAPL